MSGEGTRRRGEGKGRRGEGGQGRVGRVYPSGTVWICLSLPARVFRKSVSGEVWDGRAEGRRSGKGR